MGLKQLSLNEIEVGMRVDPRQLDEILYTRIILTDEDKNHTGRIVCIGVEDEDELYHICKDLKDVCVVYNTEEDILGMWDE